MTAKHSLGRSGVAEEATKCDLQTPVTVRSDSCQPDVHAARNSLMTDTFRKHQLWLVTVKLGRGERGEGGALGRAVFISRRLKRMMYIHANYPGDFKTLPVLSRQVAPRRHWRNWNNNDVCCKHDYSFIRKGHSQSGVSGSESEAEWLPDGGVPLPRSLPLSARQMLRSFLPGRNPSSLP